MSLGAGMGVAVVAAVVSYEHAYALVHADTPDVKSITRDLVVRR